MDVKSYFLKGFIDKDANVKQSIGFEDISKSKHVLNL